MCMYIYIYTFIFIHRHIIAGCKTTNCLMQISSKQTNSEPSYYIMFIIFLGCVDNMDLIQKLAAICLALLCWEHLPMSAAGAKFRDAAAMWARRILGAMGGQIVRPHHMSSTMEILSDRKVSRQCSCTSPAKIDSTKNAGHRWKTFTPHLYRNEGFLKWGIPKSSTLIGFSITNQPVRGYLHSWKPSNRCSNYNVGENCRLRKVLPGTSRTCYCSSKMFREHPRGSMETSLEMMCLSSLSIYTCMYTYTYVIVYIYIHVYTSIYTCIYIYTC